ncbi:peptidoglycan-binding protein [Streptomyces sp. NPDC086077]|uniref:peptidoglycan-binding protein n=1 Tax=Streptomyces sp. NPDC086077 TaxID=3154862 RepID=UPI00342E559F
MITASLALGLTAVGLAGASASFAAGPSTGTYGTTAVVNLGLSTNQAKGMQEMLIAYDLDSSMVIDGALGPDSWKAMQQMLKWFHGYDGALDGVPGPRTIVALQRWLKEDWGYSGPLDGIAGAGTQAAFARAGTYYYQLFF